MSATKQYIPKGREKKWYLVERIEYAGGGEYKQLFAILALDTTDAVRTAMNHPGKYQYASVASVVVKEKDIIVIDGKKGKKEKS